jgi:hypothetical protein
MNLHKAVRKRLDAVPVFQRVCCKDTGNLRYALDQNNRKDVLVLRCKHCHALHHRQFMGKLSV